VAATSCTRTAQAPACAASTLVTAVARSRAGSRPPRLGIRQRLGEEALAARADEHARPDRDDLLEGAQRLPVLRAALAEADARIEDDPVGRDPGGRGGRRPVLELGDEVAGEIGVGGAGVHVGGGPRQCCRTTSTPDAATTPSMSGSASPPETSLTMRAPASTPPRGARVHRVDDEGALRGERRDDRQHALLLGRGDALGAGPGRLAADVEDVGAVARSAGRARSRRRRRGSVRRR
jgi:hypothetical protein